MSVVVHLLLISIADGTNLKLSLYGLEVLELDQSSVQDNLFSCLGYGCHLIPDFLRDFENVSVTNRVGYNFGNSDCCVIEPIRIDAIVWILHDKKILAKPLVPPT